MSLRSIFAANLRALRAERGLTQEALADAAGFNRNYVGMLEREENAATIDTVEKLAIALGVTPHSLIIKPLKRPRR